MTKDRLSFFIEWILHPFGILAIRIDLDSDFSAFPLKEFYIPPSGSAPVFFGVHIYRPKAPVNKADSATILAYSSFSAFQEIFVAFAGSVTINTSIRTMLNDITEAQAWEEVGVGRRKYLENLILSLRSSDDSPESLNPESLQREELGWSGRFAPSIITRNVAELFEVSMPRFAIRVPIETSMGVSIVNLHRIALMQKQYHVVHDHPKTEGVDPLGDATGIADCVLFWPVWSGKMKNIRRVESPDLMRFYGEKKAEGKSLTSYVHCLPLSGLCAQAACFMVSAMMQPWIRSVYGFSEITLLSKEEELASSCSILETGEIFSKEIALSGLKGAAIKRYFELAGLTCAGQQFNRSTLCLPSKSQTDRFGSRDFVLPAIRAYVRSGFSVIFPCDLDRLEGRILGKVSTLNDSSPGFLVSQEDPLSLARTRANSNTAQVVCMDEGEFQDKRHAVVIVGYYREDFGDTTFVFHDPSRLPYMRLSAVELLACPPYNNEDLQSRKEGSSPSLNSPPILENPGFYSVTPPEVILPILPSYFGLDDPETNHEAQVDTAKTSITALHHDALLQYDYERAGLSFKQFENAKYNIGEMVLAAPGNLRESWSRLLVDSANEGSELHEKLLLSQQELLPEALQPWQEANQWLWLQVVMVHAQPGGTPTWLVQLWNSESWGPGLSECLLVGCCLRTLEEGWVVLHQTEVQRNRCNANSGGEIDSPKPEDHYIESTNDQSGDSGNSPEIAAAPDWPKIAVISSFSTSGVLDSGYWPEAVAHSEVYAFMFRDIVKLFPESEEDPIGAMAALAEDDENNDARFEEIARRVVSAFSNRKIRATVSAMATYFPEISCREGNLKKRGLDSLRFMIRLGGQIRAIYGMDSPFFIEFVGGGLAECIEYVDGPDGEYEAKISSPDEAIQELVTTLMQLRTLARKNHVILAAEFEPGLLNVLGHKNHLLEFCRLLDAQEESTEFVGLNLDIAHFAFLGEVTPSFLRNHPKVVDRIVHAHISDHCDGGHFGDAPVGSIHGIAAFRPWLYLLAEINKLRGPASKNRPESAIPYSGLVSVEQEACRSLDALSESIKTIKNSII